MSARGTPARTRDWTTSTGSRPRRASALGRRPPRDRAPRAAPAGAGPRAPRRRAPRAERRAAASAAAPHDAGRRAAAPRAGRRQAPAAGRRAGARRRRAPHAHARHLPARRLRPGHGLQRLRGAGLLQLRLELLPVRRQVVCAVGIGVGAMFVLSRVDYAWWRKAAVPLARARPRRPGPRARAGRRQRASTAPAAGSIVGGQGAAAQRVRQARRASCSSRR